MKTIPHSFCDMRYIFPTHVSIQYLSPFDFALMPTMFKFTNENSNNSQKWEWNNDLSLTSLVISNKFILIEFYIKIKR